jgi:hypothetical protein
MHHTAIILMLLSLSIPKYNQVAVLMMAEQLAKQQPTSK